MASRSDPETRQASLLLSGLVLTPDSALELFRERRVANKALDLEHLKRARDMLDFVSAAISSGNAEQWARIEQAWKLLQIEIAKVAAKPPPAPAPNAVERAPASAPENAEAVGEQAPSAEAGQTEPPPPEARPPEA